MRRRLFNFAAAVSLALCAGGVALWVWGRPFGVLSGPYRQPPPRFRAEFYGNSIGLEEDVVSEADFIAALSRANTELAKYGAARRVRRDAAAIPSHDVWYDLQILTIQTGTFVLIDAPLKHPYPSVSLGGTFGHWYTIVIPMWLPVIALLLLPVLSAAMFVRKRSRRSGSGCIRCHYNLTGNTSGVCPECGTPISKNSGISGRLTTD